MSEQPPADSAQTQQPSDSQQPADDEPFFPDLKLGDAWGESITANRAAELEARLQAWGSEKAQGERKGPFDTAILTGADVLWLAAQALARTVEKQAIVKQIDEFSENHLFPMMSNLHLEGATLLGTHLKGAHLTMAHLEGASFAAAYLEDAHLYDAHLEGSHFTAAHLEGADLQAAHLEGAFFNGSHLEGADLNSAHIEDANFFNTNLSQAVLGLAFMSSGTVFHDVTLGDEKSGYVSIADVRWGQVNLAVVDWTRTVRRFLRLRRRIEAIELGDERKARISMGRDGKPKDKATRLYEFEIAVRANRQLATVLRQQGLNEDADRFAYKAQKLQREVLRRQRRYGAALGSWFLDTIAGYGYRPMRSVFTYAVVVLGFAAAYFALTNFDITPFLPSHSSPLHWYEAIVLSVSSFHGRGLFPTGLRLGDPIAILAAGEAIIGLLIEITFIATFTQRFFAR